MKRNMIAEFYIVRCVSFILLVATFAVLVNWASPPHSVNGGVATILAWTESAVCMWDAEQAYNSVMGYAPLHTLR